jgi:hypothetical protein
MASPEEEAKLERFLQWLQVSISSFHVFVPNKSNNILGYEFSLSFFFFFFLITWDLNSGEQS